MQTLQRRHHHHQAHNIWAYSCSPRRGGRQTARSTTFCSTSPGQRANALHNSCSSSSTPARLSPANHIPPPRPFLWLCLRQFDPPARLPVYHHYCCCCLTNSSSSCTTTLSSPRHPLSCVQHLHPVHRSFCHPSPKHTTLPFCFPPSICLRRPARARLNSPSSTTITSAAAHADIEHGLLVLVASETTASFTVTRLSCFAAPPYTATAP